MDRRNKMPRWVYWGLWGISDRDIAKRFVNLSIAVAVIGLCLTVIYPLAICGVLMLFPALWYWAAIRWVDENGGWE